MEKCIPFLSKRMNDKLREMFDCGYLDDIIKFVEK